MRIFFVWIIISSLLSCASAEIHSGNVLAQDTKKVELFSEDPIACKLSHKSSTSLEQKQNNTLAKKEPDTLLAEFDESLTNLKTQLEEIQRRITSSEQNLAAKRKQRKVWSEAIGTIEFSPGNGGNPRIYNAIRIQPQTDSVTNLSLLLYLQNGLGVKSYDQVLALSSEFNLATKFYWNSNPIDFLFGNFFIARTPFTLYRPFRENDTFREARVTFNGVKIETKLFGLPWQGFLARNQASNDSRYDRITIFSYASLPITGGSVGLTYLQMFDDPMSSPIQREVFQSNTLSFSLEHASRLWGKQLELAGEANLNRTDPNKRTGPEASTEYALQLQAKAQTKYPIRLAYSLISRGYPITNTAIQPALPQDYIYREMDNPWQPFFVADLQRLELNLSRLKVGNFNTAISCDLARELEGYRGMPKSFYHVGSTLELDLNRIYNKLKPNTLLSLEADLYQTGSSASIDVKQRTSKGRISQQLTDNLNLALGYKFSYLSGIYNETLDSHDKYPFLETRWSPFRNGSISWEYYASPIFPRHKLELRTTVGPATWIRIKGDFTHDSSITVEYRSGF